MIIAAKGNCGIPEFINGEIHYNGTTTLMADYACFARDIGATIIGGCCGTTHEHVKAMHDALENNVPGSFSKLIEESTPKSPNGKVPGALKFPVLLITCKVYLAAAVNPKVEEVHFAVNAVADAVEADKA